jgi:hypothetical protein
MVLHFPGPGQAMPAKGMRGCLVEKDFANHRRPSTTLQMLLPGLSFSSYNRHEVLYFHEPAES